LPGKNKKFHERFLVHTSAFVQSSKMVSKEFRAEIGILQRLKSLYIANFYKMLYSI